MRTTSVRLTFLVALLFTSAAVAHAGPITGRVVDPDGRAVSGADVMLIQGSSVVATTTSADSGAFSLEAPDTGRLELRVAVDGFRARPLAVLASSGRLDVGSVALSISAVNESVVVSAAQVDVPLSTTSSSVTVMSGADLLARQVESLPDALRAIPGLTVAASGGRGALTGVFPRGGESDYSLVLVDGVPANAFGGGFDFAQLPVVNVDRIEVVRGPQSALYGSNAIGSVIRIITKRGGPPTALASLEGGSFDTMRATAATSGLLGPWEWGASAERLTSDGMNGEPTAAGQTIANDDYERHVMSAGGGWSHASGAALRGDVRYLDDERGFPGPFGSDPGGSFGGIDTVARGQNDRWLSSLSGTTARGRRVSLNGQLAHNRIDSSFVSRFGGSESYSRRTIVRMQADASIASELEGSAGIEVQRERAGSTFITADGSREVPIERSLAGFFGEARWNRAARLFVTSGIRVERITRRALPGDPEAFAPRPDFPDDTVVSANPKLSAAWYLRSAGGDFTKVRGSAGTGIRPPDSFELAFTDNPSLKPERSRSADVGVDHTFLDGRALVEATAFFNRYDDLIVAVGSFQGSSRYRTDNISNAQSRGLELAGTVRTRLPANTPIDLLVRVAYTRLDTEILAVDGGAGAPPPFSAGDALLRRPTHQVSLDAQIRSGRMSGFVSAGGRSQVRDVDPSLGTFGGIFEAPGYAVWDAGASWHFASYVEVFGRVANIFDRDYEEVLGFPALGRSVMAGLRVAAGR